MRGPRPEPSKLYPKCVLVTNPLRMFDLLLYANKDISVKNCHGFTVVNVAIGLGRKDVVEMLFRLHK